MTRCFCGLMALCLFASSLSADDRPEALLQKGIANIRLKNFKDARQPLEDAFKSATIERTKMNAAEALVLVCRETSDVNGYLMAADYVISHSERKAGRSLHSRQVCGFLHFQGKEDEAIQRYEKQLIENPDDLAALNILAFIYERSNRVNKPRAKELNEKLSALNKAIATGHAQRLEAEAAQKADLAAWNLKDAAQFWIEAEEPLSALAAANASITAAPEARSQLLTMQWREGLGDIFLQVKEPQLALEQFEAAVKSAPEGILRTNVEKKVAQSRGEIK